MNESNSYNGYSKYQQKEIIYYDYLEGFDNAVLYECYLI